jgi:serine phosphatase RsbU (regulator of sigma subunit)
VLDTGTFRLEYGSAGHDCAYVRQGNDVARLAVTGPVLGVMEEPFGSQTIDLRSDDMLVLATDGLTEVRNRAGVQLSERGAMDLIQRGSRHAQQLADELVAQARARGGSRLRDDLAVLTIRVGDGEPVRA